MDKITAIALDVDGVLTDGGFWWGANGEEYKRFTFLDVMGISLGRRAGIRFALISGEDSPLVDRFAAKMGITDVWKGCKDKAAALTAFAEQHQLPLAEICFMGDDINDLPALSLAGLSAAPATAHPSVKQAVALITAQPGGNGAVRELVDMILAWRTTEETAEGNGRVR